MQYPAKRIMIIAGGISIIYLKKALFDDQNSYAAVLIITVDFKITYVISRII